MSALPPQIFRRWVHSHEEDTPEWEVYRPSTYPFPPSRGRQAFEIRENGEFIRYDIAPAEGSRRRLGRWQAKAPDQIQLSFGDEARSESLAIHSCDKDVLKIRR